MHACSTHALQQATHTEQAHQYPLPPPPPLLSHQGKLELEMEVVTEEEEQLRPAGKSRDEPTMNPVLDPPK